MPDPATRARIVAAARTCVGARFRPQGRDPAFGLDCVGLVARAYRAAGAVPVIPCGYTLRGGSVGEVTRLVEANGFFRIHSAHAGPADMLLLRPGPRQLHFVVLTGAGFVHADAGLRRVVETPGCPTWPVLAAWRWTGIPES